MKNKNGLSALVFTAMIFMGAIQLNWTHGLNSLWQITTGIAMDDHEEWTAVEDISEEILENYPYTQDMIELSGWVMKQLHVRSYYNQGYGINVTDNGYIVGRYDETSTDYEIEQMISFKKYLDSKGIRLLYVNEPVKYIDDEYYLRQFGGESYLNRNADLFLARLDEAGIAYLDLRENIVAEGLDPLALFYRTDHHWTVPASKWAAELIAERLNADYGYRIDTTVYADENFEVLFFPDSWVGEQGLKIASSYSGPEDYTLLIPVFATSFTVVWEEKACENDFMGTFNNASLFYDESLKPTERNGHYTFFTLMEKDIYNNNVQEGSILLLGDSYENSMMPYLSLGIHHIYHVQPRYLEKSVRDFIEEGDFDTVIIAYPQLMLGAHDRGGSNYNQFKLD